MLGPLKECFYWSGCNEAVREWCNVLDAQQGNWDYLREMACGERI